MLQLVAHRYRALHALHFRLARNPGGVQPFSSNDSQKHPLAEDRSMVESHLRGKKRAIRRMINVTKSEAMDRMHSKEDTIQNGRLSREYPVTAYCTAESYDFTRLLAYLQKHFVISPYIADDVVHARLSGTFSNGQPATELFFFRQGAFVIWAPADADLAVCIREELRPFEVNPTNSVETENMRFRIGTNESGISGETIFVGHGDALDTIRHRLAFSNGLVDSVKLAVLEGYMDEHIQKVRPIPCLLQIGKKLPSRAQVLQLTGELLHFRALLNLHSELIDTPEIYWSEPELEDLYRATSRILDIRQRVSVLNKKLDYANELASVLSGHLSEKHGLKLEWGIIALIAVEVGFEMLHWVEKIAS